MRPTFLSLAAACGIAFMGVGTAQADTTRHLQSQRQSPHSATHDSRVDGWVTAAWAQVESLVHYIPGLLP